MNHIEININNWNRVDDKELLRVVRDAINCSIKYECDRTLNTHHYWHDPDRRVELQIIFK